MCNNGFGGCSWIIILILILCCCGCGNSGYGNNGCGNNGCGCNDGCGCGCYQFPNTAQTPGRFGGFLRGAFSHFP